MARRKYIKPVDPAVYDDPRYAVTVIYLSDGTGVLDHRPGARGWDEYNDEHPMTTKEQTDVNY
jgi:hypothetical protein